jgi:hypothetical protein
MKRSEAVRRNQRESLPAPLVTQHLLDTGRAMRAAQRVYFKARTQESLISSKAAEAAFDFAMQAAMADPCVWVSSEVTIQNRKLSTLTNIDLFSGIVVENKTCDGVVLPNSLSVRRATAA